ncbi:MAG: hypothetical protein QW057_05315 [Candidatus Bathyarchaeia archaeon]
MRVAANLYIVLLLVWSSMMLGFYMVFGVVLPAKLPFDDMSLPGIAGVIKVIVGATLSLLWLQCWRMLTYRYFRSAVRSRQKEAEAEQ